MGKLSLPRRLRIRNPGIAQRIARAAGARVGAWALGQAASHHYRQLSQRSQPGLSGMAGALFLNLGRLHNGSEAVDERGGEHSAEKARVTATTRIVP